MSTLDEIVDGMVGTAEGSAGAVACWAEFERRLLELVQACGGDYTKIDDPFRGFSFWKGPIPSPALLKRTYTVFYFRFKENYLIPPLHDVCRILCLNDGGSGCFTLDHLKAIHEIDPAAIKQYAVDDENEDANFSILVLLCQTNNLPTWDGLVRLVSCILWMVEKCPYLLQMNSSSMDRGDWQFYTAANSILAFYDGCFESAVYAGSSKESRAYLKDSLLSLHRSCCKSRGIHGESNICVNLFCSCIEVNTNGILEALAEECCAEDFRFADNVNLYDIILAAGKMGDNHAILRILSTLQPDITTLTSGLPLFAGAAIEGLSLSTVYTLLSKDPNACMMVVNGAANSATAD